MQNQTLMRMGAFHPVFCEDFLCVEQLSGPIWVAAVMDGCTMARESHFASTLAAKVLRKCVKVAAYDTFRASSVESLSPEEVNRHLLEQFRLEYRAAAAQLFLEPEEQMTTLLLAVAHAVQNVAHVACMGDGLLHVAGRSIELEAGNKPNYFAYHWGMPFSEFWTSQVEHHRFDGIRSLDLATDGILAFDCLQQGQSRPDTEVISTLLAPGGWDNARTLDKRTLELEQEHGLVPTDDLAIIRLKW